MIPSLSCDESMQLAATYDFSGGQIENIARKCDIHSILYGDDALSMKQIEKYCSEERIEVGTNRKIGF